MCSSQRKSIETRAQQDEERAGLLEVQVDEAKVIAEVSLNTDAIPIWSEICKILSRN
jgi:hypothetical protein